ncbi:lipopolysaccharide biosynthesis protein [Pseudomonas sp. ACN5]|jgi:O-antigen/teichoic acid export membrane protein|uniref:lipopolysaccharide biosynthesis protein n=1 Tax=Pseudomonas sp. ACN5 TaxID=1920427 RepID=UPI000BB33CA0|nr:oligosaccharide flippase family protein [Pseudomonas sp. ACN5]PBJ06973.1 Polysaccharide biosynthesis protein [Pseudomonas sp. ACN5]
MTNLINRTLEHLATPLSVSSRLLLSTVIFFIAAKILGPHEFGIFTIHAAFAMFCSQIVDFGAQTKIIRDTSTDPTRAKEHIKSALTLKTILIPVGVIFLIVSATLIKFEIKTLVYLSIFFSMSAISEIFMSSLRAQKKIKTEAVYACFSSLLIITIATYVLINYKHEYFALFLAASRTLTTAILGLYTFKITPKSNNKINENIPHTGPFSYGIDALSINAPPAIQMMIISSLLPPILVGQYQLIQRILQGLSTLLVISTQKFMPILGRSHNTQAYKNNLERYKKNNIKLLILPVALLCTLPIELIYSNIGITKETSLYTPLLIAIIISKFISATYGTVLIIEGKAKAKAKISFTLGILATGLTIIIAKIFPSALSILLLDLLVSLTILGLYKKTNEK